MSCKSWLLDADTKPTRDECDTCLRRKYCDYNKKEFRDYRGIEKHSYEPPVYYDRPFTKGRNSVL